LIRLATQHHNEIAAHGERDYPHECCGLLLGAFSPGSLKTIAAVYPISNAREEAAKRNRFLITPEEFREGEQYAEKNGLDIVGFYHSHPDHPAVPSGYDLEHAWPLYSYIVVAVRAGVAGELRSWEMEPDRSKFTEEEISMSVSPAVAGG
jgi:proteasome lid subunit RPN8/RPN11